MLFGREVESATLATALAAARAGAGAAFVLVGEPGIGKTTLLRELVEHAGEMTILETAGVESEADLPYAALIDVLTPVLHRLDALPEAQAAALSAALALGPPGAFDRFAVGVATLGLLAAAADDGPALIVVDDLQWVDSASRDALSFASRRLAGVRAVFVAAQRPGAPSDARPPACAGRSARPRRLDQGARSERGPHCAGRAEVDPRCGPREPARARRVAPLADTGPARRDRGARQPDPDGERPGASLLRATRAAVSGGSSGDRCCRGGQLRHSRCRAGRVRGAGPHRAGSQRGGVARSAAHRRQPARVPSPTRSLRRLPRRRAGRTAPRARCTRGLGRRSRSACLASSCRHNRPRRRHRGRARPGRGAGACERGLQRRRSGAGASRLADGGARSARRSALAGGKRNGRGREPRPQPGSRPRRGKADRRPAPARGARHSAGPPPDGGGRGGSGARDAPGRGRADERARSSPGGGTAQLRREPAVLPARGACRRRADRARVESWRPDPSADPDRTERVRPRQDDGR